MTTDDPTASMRTVTSADGTEIAYERVGDGDPMVLVHGTMATRHAWRPIRPLLADERSLVVPDRRGRGESGDGDDYSLASEVADVRAVIESVEGDPVVFGHSFGGLCALEAARQTSVESLILYDPTVLTGAHREGADLADRMQALLDRGEREESVKEFLRELGEAEGVEEWPIWPECTRLAETMVRETRAIENYELDDEIDVSAPTLLLRGGTTPDHLHDATVALSDALTRHTLVELDGVGHSGLSTAPELVASEITDFLSER